MNRAVDKVAYKQQIMRGITGDSNLLLGDSHVILYIYEDSWLNEVTLITVPTTAAHHLGSFVFSTLDQLGDLVKLLLVDLFRENETAYTNR